MRIDALWYMLVKFLVFYVKQSALNYLFKTSFKNALKITFGNTKIQHFWHMSRQQQGYTLTGT